MRRAIGYVLRNIINTVRAARPTPRNAEQGQPASGPKAMAGDRLIGIFRTGGQMAAMIAYKSRKRQLV